MLKLLSRLSNRIKASQRPERVDAKRIYAKVMTQSRNPLFYAPGLVEDSTDGRMEWLTVHLSVVLHTLQRFGEDGAKLSQAIYDTMVDDFDIALREEGLSDSGVKRRIKPLAKMFLSRARAYAEAMESDETSLSEAVQKYVLTEKDLPERSHLLAEYITSFTLNSAELSLDQIANTQLSFPAFPPE